MEPHDCFVISPIGSEGSEERRHANEVLRFIIQPALKKLGLTSIRADQTTDLGSITSHMISDILASKFCIAVLTGLNPNVFYELAVAHSAGIPVVILYEKSLQLPFDVKDYRAIPYDLWPSQLIDGIYSDILVEMIKRVESTNYKRSVIFASGISPLGSTMRQLTIWPKTDTVESADLWIDFVNQAQETLDIGGVGLVYWSGLEGMLDALLGAARREVRIRVLTMHRTNPARIAFFNPEVTRDKIDKDEDSVLEIARNRFTKKLVGFDYAEVQPMMVGVFHQQIVINENKCLAIPYLYSLETDQGPLIECMKESVLYQTFSREFDAIWRMNSHG